MRIIIFGVGAIGGTLAASLAMAGEDVVGVARGQQLSAIQAEGLMLYTPDGIHRARFECVATPSDIEFRPDDVIILTVKGQDTEAALAQLVAAGVTEQPIFCAQNGVENERRAMRLFPNVHGMTVLLPAEFITPGKVVVFGGPKYGIFDIGRYPSGSDQADEKLVAAFNRADFAAFPSQNVMASKYGKLLLNLGNISGAALGNSDDAQKVRSALRAEGERVLSAAGIDWLDVGADDPRRKDNMTIREIEGIDRVGSSTAQSLARGAGSVETDFLNGEIVLLGRMHGINTPLNSWFCSLASRMLREAIEPGSINAKSVLAEFAL